MIPQDRGSPERPQVQGEPVEAILPHQPEDPTGGKGSPMRQLMGDLMKEGGMVLHGEQEFVYHQPVQVGETLHYEGKVVDLYSKEAKGKTMTFLVMESVYTNDAGDPVVTERFNLIHRK